MRCSCPHLALINTCGERVAWRSDHARFCANRRGWLDKEIARLESLAAGSVAAASVEAGAARPATAAEQQAGSSVKAAGAAQQPAPRRQVARKPI